MENLRLKRRGKLKITPEDNEIKLTGMNVRAYIQMLRFKCLLNDKWYGKKDNPATIKLISCPLESYRVYTVVVFLSSAMTAVTITRGTILIVTLSRWFVRHQSCCFIGVVLAHVSLMPHMDTASLSTKRCTKPVKTFILCTRLGIHCENHHGGKTQWRHIPPIGPTLVPTKCTGSKNPTKNWANRDYVMQVRRHLTHLRLFEAFWNLSSTTSVNPVFIHLSLEGETRQKARHLNFNSWEFLFIYWLLTKPVPIPGR